MHYVDGLGWESGSSRSANYCPHCQHNPPSALSPLRSAVPQRHDNQRSSNSFTPAAPTLPATLEPQAKACGHTGCQLTTPAGCCACLDLRPLSPEGYRHYVDGRGWLSGGSRTANYCPSCQVAPPSQHPPTGSLAASRLSALQPSPSSPMPLGLDVFSAAGSIPNLPSPLPAQIPSSPSKETRGQAEEDLCKICFTAAPDALFLPCAHLVSCTSCAVLILTHNSPSWNRRHGEIDGRDLIERAERLQSEPGQLSYSTLISITSTGKVRTVCPICRDLVKRWIRVYRS